VWKDKKNYSFGVFDVEVNTIPSNYICYVEALMQRLYLQECSIGKSRLVIKTFNIVKR